MATRTIPFFNYPALFRKHERDYLVVIREVLGRGAYIMQRDLFEFEAALAAYLKVKHAIGTADGTMALLVSLKALGLQPGDEVIVPSHTFVATAAAVHHAGAVPVLADCGKDHLIDVSSAARMISPRTRAILPVQLNGRTADMEALGALAAAHRLVVVEDACQALGSRFKGRFAGTFGLAGAFSFYPSKTLGAFGDGGAVVTDDDALAETIRRLRDHGRGPDGKVSCFGYNARLDNLQAAILLWKLRRYDEEIDYRRRLARRYHENLRDIPSLELPPPPVEDGIHFDIYQNYEIEAERRDALRAHLAAHGVQTILQWGGYVLHQFEALGMRGDCAFSEAMTRRFLLLPMNSSLAFEDIDYISETIRAFYR